MSDRKDFDVGICEFLGSHTGFQGVIKTRFEDFLVNEIDEDGNVVHLTNMSLPVKSEDEQQNTCNVLSEQDKEKLASLLNNDGPLEITIKPGDSKEERTAIHKAIRFLYPELESETWDDHTGGKLIMVKKAKGKRAQLRRPRNLFCKFVLYKTNIGTMEAVNFIAKKLRVRKANGFQYAGTKDKRGITAQLISAPAAAERLHGLNMLNSSIKVGNFSSCNKPLQLGALTGNHFSIVIRDVTGIESLESSLESFGNKGFINYFGLQRFGTTSVPTHSIGISILRSEWKNVIDLVLAPKEPESRKGSNFNEAFAKYKETGDANAALDILWHKSSIEGQLLQGLQRYGEKQLLQAIIAMPRNTRKMYVHAYQSIVWNKIASKRIQEFGDKPVPGDLVYTSLFKSKMECKDSDLDQPQAKKPRTELESSDSDAVTIISEENCRLFSLEDIVLPLPGHNIKYPGKDGKSWYAEIMGKDGIDIDKHMIHKVKDFSLPGDYRYLITKPGDLHYDLVKYDDFTIPLLQSDLDRLDGLEKPGGVENGKYQAIRLEFSLPPSSYATVAVRELMKTDISILSQTKLNEKQSSNQDVEDS